MQNKELTSELVLQHEKGTPQRSTLASGAVQLKYMLLSQSLASFTPQHLSCKATAVQNIL